MAKHKVLPHVVFGIVVEPVSEIGGVALKIKHSPGPNATYGRVQLETHFVMPRAYAEDLRAALETTLANLPPRQLNA